MTSIILQSGNATAEILPDRGALVSSLAFDQNDPILWLPSDFDKSSSAWPGGGMPFLFPFAGRVQHLGELYKYGLGDRVYAMPIHGFSWATNWSVKNRKRDTAILQLNTSEPSLAVYPFDFSVDMSLQLESNSLIIDIVVCHRTPKAPTAAPKMPVALGWHPYFSLAHSPMSLTLASETAFPVTPQGMAGKPVSARELLGPAPWVLPKAELQSLILGQLKNCDFELRRPNGRKIKITAAPSQTMAHIVTWTNNPEAFICVEPWMSRPDAVATPTGCQWLAPGESLQARLTILGT